MTELVKALFLATANYGVVNYLADPLRKKFPDVDMWWIVYVSFVTGGVLAWVSGINLFADYIPNIIAARVVTALVVGGGSNLIYQVFGKN